MPRPAGWDSKRSLGPPGPWLCTDLGSPGGRGVVVTHCPVLEPPGPLLAVPSVLCSLSHCLSPSKRLQAGVQSVHLTGQGGFQRERRAFGTQSPGFLLCFLSLWLFLLVLLNTYVLTALLIVMKGDYRISEIQIISI